MKPPVPVDPVVLHTFHGAWGVRSLSPFCLKADAVLHLAGVPMKPRLPSGPPKNKTGKLPCLEASDGTFVEGSDAIVDWLREQRGIDLDQGLTAAQKAQALLARRTIEEHLYFALIKERWLEDAGFAVARPVYFASLPGILRAIIPAFIRRTVRRDAHGHGLSRMSDDRIQRRIAEDLDALSALLGDHDWFFGDRPTSLDATLYGFSANMLATPVSPMLRAAFEARPNLIQHKERFEATVYSD